MSRGRHAAQATRKPVQAPNPQVGLAIKPPLRLTQRGRILRDMIAGTTILSAAIFAQPISVALFTALDWSVQISGGVA